MSDIYEWPIDSEIGRGLRSLEEALTCPICTEFMDNAHSLPCGHTFCSICIRKHFDRKLNSVSFDQCPSCRDKSEVAHLRSNKQIQSVIITFTSIRSNLLSLIKKSNGKEVAIGESGAKKSTSSNRTSNATSTTTTASSVAKDTVQRIVMKDLYKWPKEKIKNEIRAVCSRASVCLLLDGSTDELEHRYRELVHLNNAQIASLNPLSLTECIKEINKRESAKIIEQKKYIRSEKNIESLRNGEVTEVIDRGYRDLVKFAKEKKQEILRASLSKATTGSDSQSHLQQQQQQQQQSSQDEQLQQLSCFSAMAATDAPALQPGPAARAAVALEDFDGLVDSHNNHWRCIFSTVANSPFYYCIETGIGQFTKPELLQLSAPTTPALSSSSFPSSAADATTSSSQMSNDSNSNSNKRNRSNSKRLNNNDDNDTASVRDVVPTSQTHDEPLVASQLSSSSASIISGSRLRSKKLARMVLESQESLEDFSSEISKINTMKRVTLLDSDIKLVERNDDDNDDEEADDDDITFIGDSSTGIYDKGNSSDPPAAVAAAVAALERSTRSSRHIRSSNNISNSNSSSSNSISTLSIKRKLSSAAENWEKLDEEGQEDNENDRVLHKSHDNDSESNDDEEYVDGESDDDDDFKASRTSKHGSNKKKSSISLSSTSTLQKHNTRKSALQPTSTGKPANASSSGSAVWSCEVCTFINKPAATSCEVCTYNPSANKSSNATTNSTRSSFGSLSSTGPTTSISPRAGSASVDNDNLRDKRKKSGAGGNSSKGKAATTKRR